MTELKNKYFKVLVIFTMWFLMLFISSLSIYAYENKAVELQSSINKNQVSIKSIDDMKTTITYAHIYYFPKTVAATMSNGSKKNVIVKWNKGLALPGNDQYKYEGTVNGYNKKVKLIVTYLKKDSALNPITEKKAITTDSKPTNSYIVPIDTPKRYIIPSYKNIPKGMFDFPITVVLVENANTYFDKPLGPDLINEWKSYFELINKEFKPYNINLKVNVITYKYKGFITSDPYNAYRLEDLYKKINISKSIKNVIFIIGDHIPDTNNDININTPSYNYNGINLIMKDAYAFSIENIEGPKIPYLKNIPSNFMIVISQLLGVPDRDRMDESGLDQTTPYTTVFYFDVGFDACDLVIMNDNIVKASGKKIIDAEVIDFLDLQIGKPKVFKMYSLNSGRLNTLTIKESSETLNICNRQEKDFTHIKENCIGGIEITDAGIGPYPSNVIELMKVLPSINSLDVGHKTNFNEIGSDDFNNYFMNPEKNNIYEDWFYGNFSKEKFSLKFEATNKVNDADGNNIYIELKVTRTK